MKKLLIVGNNRFFTDDLANIKIISDGKNMNFTKEILKDIDVLMFDLDEIDADIFTEEVVDLIIKEHYKFDKIIYLTRLGIDLEYDDQKFFSQKISYQEYLKQQRYAIKLIDELEQPYTIIRIPEFKEKNGRNPIIIPEGKKITTASVSHETIKQILSEVILTNKYDNQSIAVLDD